MKKWMHLAAACVAALVLAGCGATGRSVILQPSDRAAAPRPASTGRTSGAGYSVVRGDTLYSIAFRHGLDFRDLAALNGIAAPYRIWPGQVLRLSASQGGVRSSRTRQPGAAVATHQPAKAPVFQSVTPAPVRQGASPVPSTATSSTPAAAPSTGRTPAASAPVSPKGLTHDAGGIAWRWPADGALIKRFESGDAIPGIELAGKAGDPVRAAADGVVVYSGNGLVGYGELIIIKHNDSFLSAYGHNRKRLVKEGQQVSVGQVIAEMGSTGASRDELQFQIRRDGNPVDPLNYLPPR